MDLNNGTIFRIDPSSQSAKSVKIAVIQPPSPTEGYNSEAIQAAALDLFEQALGDDSGNEDRPDVVCLPEYLNCMNHDSGHSEHIFGSAAQDLLDDVAARARRTRCNVILPLIIDDGGGKRYNRAHVINREGNLVGHFDKIHVTDVEREQFGIEPGSDWPVFDLDFGRIGIMICYDGCFIESSRVLALQGARIIFWPSLQRSYTRDQLELQTRSHAYFNYTAIARSSYGGPTSRDNGDRMVGLSCICNAEGTILQSIDSHSGWTSARVDLDRQPQGVRTFGGLVGNLRDMRFEDRCPDKYGLICETAQRIQADAKPQNIDA